MATKNVMQFLDVEREDPTKAEAHIRLRDFKEIYGQYAADDAARQAGRRDDLWKPNRHPASECPRGGLLRS